MTVGHRRHAIGEEPLLFEKHREDVEKILNQYPADHQRSAVMPLLFLAQQEEGFVEEHAVREIASMLNLEPTQVASLIGFYTLYHQKPGGKYRIQICTDLPCALNGAEEFLAGICTALGIEPHGVTEDGLFSVEPVMCLACCDRAPMFQIQGPDGIHYHQRLTVEKALKIIEKLREGEGHD